MCRPINQAEKRKEGFFKPPLSEDEQQKIEPQYQGDPCVI